MKTFIHHNTGEWVRNDDWTSATRTDSSVTEYQSVAAIENKWLRDTFTWMLNNGLTVTQCGSDVFQIREVKQ
jgi:hypothetical protein